MPRFNVNAPDGSIIPVDAPEGATEQDAIAFAASTWKPAPAAPAIPAAVAPSEIPAARQAPGFMTQLGRGAASLADVTVGGLLPAAVQQIGYPLARIGRSEEEAKAATQRLVGAVDQPFGKAFKVTGTPEYQQESGRQLLDFIGQNFQKGAKWISDKTGLPAADIENMIGTATLAAPKVVPPVVQAVQRGAAPVIEKAIVGAKMPFEGQLQARREAASLKDYARGPQIDAAAEAQRLGIALNPTDIQPTIGPKLTTMLAGEKGVEAITAANKGAVRKVALEDMGLSPTSQLNGPTAFQEARVNVSKPYQEVRNLPIQQADDAMLQRLESIRSDLDVIGAKEYAPAISKIVDDAISKTQTGLTGDKLLKNISVLRERAKKTYNNKAATTEALDIADTNLRIATELESMIDGSITNPKLLGEYRDARQKMARIYAYEAATDFNTGMVDPSKLARLTASNNALTGNIASLGKIAGNFPDVFTTKAATPWNKAAAIGRTGAAGTLGGLAGYALGQDYVSAAMGSVLGAGAGKIGESMAANRLASPGYQAGLQLRDMRIPVNQLAESMQPSTALATVPPEVFGPSGVQDANKLRIVSYDANGVPIYAAEERGQGFTMPSQPGFGAAPSPYAQRALPNEVPKQIYQAQKNAELAQEFRAAAERKPTGRGSVLEFDPITGTYKVGGEGVKGATPDILESTGKAAITAAEKARAGQFFNMSAEEKIQWGKSVLEGMPVKSGETVFSRLTTNQILDKISNRQGAADFIKKARDEAQAFTELANRQKTAQARREILIKREQLLDMLADLEDGLRPARPVSSGVQGPKTRAFNRNKLAPITPSMNELAP